MLRILALIFVGMLALTGCDEPEVEVEIDEPGLEEPDDLVFEEEEEEEMEEEADEAEEAAEEDEDADEEEADEDEEPEEEDDE